MGDVRSRAAVPDIRGRPQAADVLGSHGDVQAQASPQRQPEPQLQLAQVQGLHWQLAVIASLLDDPGFGTPPV